MSKEKNLLKAIAKITEKTMLIFLYEQIRTTPEIEVKRLLMEEIKEKIKEK